MGGGEAGFAGAAGRDGHAGVLLAGPPDFGGVEAAAGAAGAWGGRRGATGGRLAGGDPHDFLDAGDAVHGLADGDLLHGGDVAFAHRGLEAAEVAGGDQIALLLAEEGDFVHAVLAEVADALADRADLGLVLDEDLAALLEELLDLALGDTELLEHVRRGRVGNAAVRAELAEELAGDDAVEHLAGGPLVADGLDPGLDCHADVGRVEADVDAGALEIGAADFLRGGGIGKVRNAHDLRVAAHDGADERGRTRGRRNSAAVSPAPARVGLGVELVDANALKGGLGLELDGLHVVDVGVVPAQNAVEERGAPVVARRRDEDDALAVVDDELELVELHGQHAQLLDFLVYHRLGVQQERDAEPAPGRRCW